MDDFYENAKTELAPKIASSAYVVTIAPDEIDPKIAMETGYSILLDKPIIVVVSPGRSISANLRKVAHLVITLREPMGTEAGTQQLMAELAAAGIGS